MCNSGFAFVDELRRSVGVVALDSGVDKCASPSKGENTVESEAKIHAIGIGEAHSEGANKGSTLLNTSVASMTVGTDTDGDAVSTTTFFARPAASKDKKCQSYDDMFSDDEDHTGDNNDVSAGNRNLSSVALFELEQEVARRHAELLSLRML